MVFVEEITCTRIGTVATQSEIGIEIAADSVMSGLIV